MYLADDFVSPYDYEPLEDRESARIKEHGADHLSFVYDMLSGAQFFDVRELYSSLEEIAHCLDWDMPYKPEHEDYLHKLIV